MSDSPERGIGSMLRRAAHLRRLARAMQYPSPGHVREVTALLEAEPRDAAFAGVLAAWRDADEDAVVAGYVRLFHGTVQCPPNETAWSRTKGLTGGAAELADIQGFYHAFGFEATGAGELPDHIGTELEFHAALLIKLGYARMQDWVVEAEITASALRSFLTAHVGRWVSAFAARLRELDAPSPYRETGDAIEAAIAAECDAFDVRVAAAALVPYSAEPDAIACGHFAAAHGTAARHGALPVLNDP